MNIGVTVGKFYPFHMGHHYLITQAKAQVDKLIVIVSYKPDQSISGEVRADWIRQIHPDVEVVLGVDNLPADDWHVIAKRTYDLLDGRQPKFVFTSEDYGNLWARAMGCDHILIDTKRNTYPVSGTQLRQNINQYWNMLAPPTKAYFSKRICCIGVESSGTTTLATNLAEHYQTVWIPEYGRHYSQGRHHTLDKEPWNTDDFVTVAKGQIQWEDNLALHANKLVVCDTDAFATHLWHKRYVGQYSSVVEAIADSRHYGLYLLSEPDFPFVQDGTRDGEHIRMEMHQWFIDELTHKNHPFIRVTGSRKNRIEQATQAIDKLLDFPELEMI